MPTETGPGVGLRLERVRRVFDNEFVVIEGMDLRIDAGEFLAVLGPSGCGKSTLLRMIARLSAPDGGRIVTEPEAVPDRVRVSGRAPAAVADHVG